MSVAVPALSLHNLQAGFLLLVALPEQKRCGPTGHLRANTCNPAFFLQLRSLRRCVLFYFLLRNTSKQEAGELTQSRMVSREIPCVSLSSSESGKLTGAAIPCFPET